MKSLLPIALFLLVIASYMGVAMGLGIDQTVPWIPLMAGLAICGWAAWQWSRQRTTSALAATVVTALLLGSLSWYTLGYSSYEASTLAASDGDTLEAVKTMVLADHNGQQTPVISADEGAQATLLVVYRGHW